MLPKGGEFRGTPQCHRDASAAFLWRILAMKTLAGLITAAGLVFTVACSQTDAGITTKVKSKLAADDTVKAYQVDVDTTNKVVTLRGDVETVAQKEHAVTIARNTEGVADVNPTAATTGLDDIGNDRDDPNIGDDIEAGARKAGSAAKEGAKKTGDAVKDVFTDKDRDSDNDGK
jgi:hypothetical protein